MDLSGNGAQFHRKRGCHHHLVRRGDVGELRVHFRADIFELDGEDWLPRLGVRLEDDIEDAQDDALLRLRKVASFDARMEASVAAEQIVDQQKDEARIEDHQGRATQRLHVHQVQIGRHHQVADELAVFRDAHGTDRHFGAAAQEVEQPHAQQPGETLVDNFQRWHPAAHDTLLGCQVVGTNSRDVFRRLRVVLVSVDTLQKGIDFFLGEEIIGHGCLLNDECGK
ncbi:hypothetical protein D3C72_1338710 [compost metagenome]